MAATDESHIRDALLGLQQAVYRLADSVRDIALEMNCALPRYLDLEVEDQSVWNVLDFVEGHINAIRVKGDAARERKEAAHADTATG